MATVSFKAVVYSHHRKKDGTYNVKIRITHKRQTRQVATNLTVTADDITRGKLRIKNEQVITQADELISRWRTIINNLGMVVNSLSVDEIITHIKETEKDGGTFRLDFIAYGRQVASRKCEGSARSYFSALNCLERFAGPSVDISRITGKFLEEFENFIANEPLKNKKDAEGKTKAGGRAISLYMACLRAIHNEAKREFNQEDIGIVKIPQSPFLRYKVKKPPRSKPRPLSPEKIQAIINLPNLKRTAGPPNETTRHDLARDCYLLSFGLAGMNAADLYDCEANALNRENNVITYYRKKTRTRRDDRAEMKIRIEPCLWPLVEKYLDPYGERLFKFHYMYSSPTSFNNALNIGLHQIEKAIGAEHITFYTGRHSWASTGRTKAGIDKYTIHEGLNHIDDAMKVTDIYTEKAWNLIWDANAKVLSLFDWSALHDELECK